MIANENSLIYSALNLFSFAGSFAKMQTYKPAYAMTCLQDLSVLFKSLQRISSLISVD